MQDVRRVILYLSGVIGVWVLVSFAGTMFDTANAAIWVDSLMWSLLSSLIVMPALLLVSHASMKKGSRRKTPQKTRSQPQSSSNEDQKPFVDKSTRELQTLWPEPEQENEWPPSDVAQEQRRSQQSVRAEA
jgi:hypothetical protein